MFMAGMDPFSNINNSTEWVKCQCDARFCGSASAPCNWSYFAVDTLMENNKETPCNSFFNKQFDDYQFSDGFSNPHGLSDWTTYTVKYPSSLLAQYHQTITTSSSRWNNYDHLFNLMRLRMLWLRTDEVPPPDTLVIHLRLGDVIDNARESTRDLLIKQQYFYTVEGARNRCISPSLDRSGPLIEDWNAYVKPLGYFSEKLHYISNFKSVVIMSAGHSGDAAGGCMSPVADLFKGDSFKSCQYLHALKSYLARANVSVSLRLGHSPDDDMMFGFLADGFLPSGGGFSRIIATIHDMRIKKKMRENRKQRNR